MSARFRRMAARLWPDSLFGRLGIILFSGLVAAHVLAFVLIVFDRMAIEDELGNTFAAVDIADAVAILDYVEPEERPAWLDRLSRRHWRYVLGDGGELEAQPSSKRLQANIARLRAVLGPAHDANFVYFDPPTRLRRGILIHLTDGSPLTLEIFWQGASHFAMVAGGARRSTLYYRILRLGCRKARDATAGAPRARGQQPGFGFAR